jgi:hypothetical protein
MTVVTGDGPEKMKILVVKLREADPKLRRELLHNFRAQAAPLVAKVQNSILDMPVEHPPRPGVPLRAEVADTVTSSVGLNKSGVRLDIVSLGRRMPEGSETLPFHLDQPQGWSHPVFGRGPRFTMGRSQAKRFARRPTILRPMVKRGAWTWVRERGKPGWFERPISESARNVQEACQRAMDEVKRKLDF